MFSLNGVDAPSGLIMLPARNVWIARLTLSTEKAPAIGSRAIITAGSLSLVGTVRRSGTHVSSVEVEVIAGAGGWKKRLDAPKPPYRADNGVRLSQVLSGLALDTGETVVLEPGAERVLGYAWSRAAGSAATALEDLTGGAWWVAPDGVTHVGARPAGARTAAPWSVERYSAAAGSLVFTTPAEDLAAFPIGGELAAEGIEPFVIGSLEIRWAAATVRLSAWRR
jgi:hypothetical protein